MCNKILDRISTILFSDLIPRNSFQNNIPTWLILQNDNILVESSFLVSKKKKIIKIKINKDQLVLKKMI